MVVAVGAKDTQSCSFLFHLTTWQRVLTISSSYTLPLLPLFYSFPLIKLCWAGVLASLLFSSNSNPSSFVGGTGWSKSDNPNGAAEPPQTPTNQAPAVPPPPPPQPANDLRPSWLVAANAEQQANNSQAREFPSLAPPANDSDKSNSKLHSFFK